MLDLAGMASRKKAGMAARKYLSSKSCSNLVTASAVANSERMSKISTLHRSHLLLPGGNSEAVGRDKVELSKIGGLARVAVGRLM